MYKLNFTVFLRLIMVLFFSVAAVSAYGQQTTKVRGQVKNADTGEPMAYVGITVPGTSIATTTDANGVYFLETRLPVSEVKTLYLSFESQTKPVEQGKFNTIDFALVEIVNEIEVFFTIKKGENPAHRILRNVSKHKPQNSPAYKDSYTYTTYTKLEFDIANMKPEFKNKKLQKNFGFVFDYMDTSAMTGQAYLPVMISEASADYYYRKSPTLSREIVNASRISGMQQGTTFTQFTGNMHANINIYDNFIDIFNMNFASPIHDNGTSYYKYTLVDSLYIDGRMVYNIRFHPKNKASPLFDGQINIDALTWGVESVSMKMIDGLNVNWIRHLMIDNKYQIMGDTTWFMKQDYMMADFTIDTKDSSKIASIMAHKTVDYADIRINVPIPADIEKYTTNVITDNAYLPREDNFWDSIRPYQLSAREQGIFEMVDSIKNVPLFRDFMDILNTVLFGYIKVGKSNLVELGPYYKIYSRNNLEGSRLQLGARTTRNFSTKVRLSGYAAYSFKDEQVKGGAGVEYMFNNNPTSKLTVSAERNAIQLGASKDAYSTGNIMGTIFSRGSNNKLTLVHDYALQYEKEWTQGFTNGFMLNYRRIFPNAKVPFERPDGTTMGSLYNAALHVGTRFSKDEIVMRDMFTKSYGGSKYPVLDIELSAGLKNFMNSDTEYFRAEATLEYDFNVWALGRSNLVVSGGKIFGKVPYPLLKLHEGNATYLYDKWAFSCMNFYEFASDSWAQILYEHHFRGALFKRLPLLRKTKLREVITAKVLWGELSSRNNGDRSLAGTNAVLLFPEGMSAVKKPYVEVGCGIENIFSLFRVDAVWRVTHRESKLTKSVDNFSLNVSFALQF